MAKQQKTNAAIDSKNGLKPIALKKNTPEPRSIEIEKLMMKNLSQTIQERFGGTPQYAVFYLDFGIRFAKWENNAFAFFLHDYDPSFLQLARIFNEERELKIWKDNDKFLYRLRIDEPGDEYGAVEAEQLLWGTHTESLGKGWTRLWEERGTELIVPFDISIPEGQAAPRTRACIRTRNYIDYLSNGQASYVDCRFVTLKEHGKE
jgi:CRISPR-associated protein (TIGR03984 family)